MRYVGTRSRVPRCRPLEARRTRRRRRRSGGLRREEQAGGCAVGNSLALPSRSGSRPVHRQPCDDGRRAKRDDAYRAVPSRRRASDRLLLRLPDDQRSADGQRESCDRVPGARGCGCAGRAVLAGLPRLRACLPADHSARPRAPEPHHSCGRGHRLRQRACCLPRLHRALQPRSRDRVHRPLAGRCDPDPTAEARGRREAGDAAPSRLGHRARREPHRAERQERRRRFRTHPSLPIERADRLRGRLLELHVETSAEQSVRPHHFRCGRAPPRSTQPLARPQDHVRQPGLPGRRNRATRSLPPVAGARVPSCRQRAEGANALGLLSRRISRPLRVVRKRDLASSHPRRRQRGSTSSPCATARPCSRPPCPRRQHRARQPRPARPRRGCLLPRP